MASTYYNQTLALTYEEDGKWALALDKDKVLFGTDFGKLLTYIQNNLVPQGYVVIWCYHLSEMVIWVGEENFTHIQKDTVKSFNVKWANINKNIIFKNSNEFYNVSLKEIAAQKHVNSSNELAIIWNAAESEKMRSGGKVDKIPITLTGYVRKELDNLNLINDFYRLGLSITEETHDIITKCKSGGLCGIDKERKDIPTYVNCYDFKSFYPWIMVSQVFPYYSYRLKKNLSKQDFIRYAEAPLWIATINFKYIKPKINKTDWLKAFGLDIEYTITNLDFKIIMEDYEFKIAEVKEMIPFYNPQPLPDKLKNYIFEKFKIKETFSKNSEEYEQAKKALNSIYGLFNQDPKKYNKEITNRSAKQRPMVIGRFVAAYGRYFLWSIMHNTNPLHWDTDGFKTIEDLDLNEFNQMRKIEGTMLGQLIQEESWAEVIVFGNKQYMINGKLKLAGTDGELAKEYFDKIGTVPHCGSRIAAEYTSQVRLVGNKIIKTYYTIGKDGLDDILQRNN